ncbi:protease I [Rhodoblastus acidophilus]|uniref:Protease I n=1 Tax=Rhodoblastus acidophilus TaxID=1074 RepID=A0A212QZE7_RHOAC|nr:type 1 glutamine amidotransferase domain-containing protein [Rhodoblastus acidophilus]MCW2315644.1 protease I [Rhodoblastus acidophilus]PPQ40536.1 type 1 glutamine amidotransferase [Rhodoblastus acidophilus]RAI18628.1 type 1 glutamine amidotransferase [Rhodoblastus acidophilus]SNB65103.1 protease I [Rhodoblastus acidophilus]
MTGRLEGQKIAVLATDGVEEVELTNPVEALKREGAEVQVVSNKSGTIQAFRHYDKAGQIPVDTALESADARDYDGLVLPGGVINPDALRLAPQAIDFVRRFVDENRPIAAICHGPWTLIDAGGVSGKRITSWPSLKTDLANAGATWVDEQVVVDGNLVTSRKPDDLDAFDAQMVELFAQRVTARPDPATLQG